MKSLLLVLAFASTSVFADYTMTRSDARKATRLLIQAGAEADDDLGVLTTEVSGVICLDTTPRRRSCSGYNSETNSIVRLRDPAFFIGVMRKSGERPVLGGAERIWSVSKITCSVAMYNEETTDMNRNYNGAGCVVTH